ncbi:22081_t:CDS:1, partial [Gigaspora rosea]
MSRNSISFLNTPPRSQNDINRPSFQATSKQSTDPALVQLFG